MYLLPLATWVTLENFLHGIKFKRLSGIPQNPKLQSLPPLRLSRFMLCLRVHYYDTTTPPPSKDSRNAEEDSSTGQGGQAIWPLSGFAQFPS